MITAEQLAAICPRLGDRVQFWVDPLNVAMAVGNINTPARVAAFIAQAAYESGEFTQLEENLNYGGDALLRVFPRYFKPETVAPYVRNPQAIANRVYANRMGNGDEASGDGWRYRGRGIFQITGRDNYRAIELANGIPCMAEPELLADPDAACISAVWYWGVRNLNLHADRGAFDTICDLVNLGHQTAAAGDSHGYASRKAYFDRAVAVLS